MFADIRHNWLICCGLCGGDGHSVLGANLAQPAAGVIFQ
jgi:hypothetical protein